MNLLVLVFGLLLIFACTFSLSLRKDSLAAPVEKTYTANFIATREILNDYESQIYKGLRNKKAAPLKSKKSQEPKKSKLEINHLNRDCARLNLWPLLEDDREKHRALYETAAALLRTFYASALFEGQNKHEYALLDALLDSAKSQILKNPTLSCLTLEKLSLKDGKAKPLHPLHLLYYRMMKGTKKISSPQDYPSLLDYFSFENNKTKICLKHASIEMLGILFGLRAAPLLYEEIHKSKTPILQERIEEICRQTGRIGSSEDLFALLDLHSSHRSSGQKTLIAEEANVSLKKKVFLPT